MPNLRERRILPELLDDSQPDQARASLRDLTRINRYLGGYVALRRLFNGLVRTDEAFSVLDVGAASGDMGVAIRKHYPRASVVSLDYREHHLAHASPPRVVADAFHLPFSSDSFDFVFSSLFLHHFTGDRVIHLFAGFAAVARRAVLAIDLERGPLAYHFIPATRWLFHWHPITLHDAPVSVQAGFKREELRELAGRAGLQDVQVRVCRPWGRLTLRGLLK